MTLVGSPNDGLQAFTQESYGCCHVSYGCCHVSHDSCHVSCGCCHVSYNCCHVSLEGRTVGATEKGKKTLTLGAGQFECWNESESEFVEKKRLWQDNSFG